jgi:hypothetical protein
MASRPPESPGPNDDDARNRWMVIQAMRLGGVAMVLIGILGLRHVFEYPEIGGYILVAVGLVDVFLVPQLLARKWRTPPE